MAASDEAERGVGTFERAHAVGDLGALDVAWSGTRVEVVEVGGHPTRLLRRDADPGVAPGAPTIVCVHGLGGAATNFADAMVTLASHGDVVAVDLPGFGETAPEDGRAPTPDANAAFLVRLVGELALGPVVLVGNSMGGMVVTLAVAAEPSLAAAVVLLGPALPAHLPSVRLTGVQVRNFGPLLVPVVGPRLLRRRLARLTFEQQYRASLRDLTAHPDRIPERVAQVGIANLARMRDLPWRGRSLLDATGGLLDLQLGRRRSHLLAAMRDVAVPTLYLRGRRDPLVLGATTVLCRRLGLDWTIEEPADLGHVIQIEDPGFLAHRLGRFLAEHGLA